MAAQQNLIQYWSKGLYTVQYSTPRLIVQDIYNLTEYLISFLRHIVLFEKRKRVNH